MSDEDSQAPDEVTELTRRLGCVLSPGSHVDNGSAIVVEPINQNFTRLTLDFDLYDTV